MKEQVSFPGREPLARTAISSCKATRLCRAGSHRRRGPGSGWHLQCHRQAWGMVIRARRHRGLRRIQQGEQG